MVLLREHIERFGAGPGGRVFRSENGPIQPSTCWRVWQETRILALPSHLAGYTLMRRPYDLRHSGITWRLNSGSAELLTEHRSQSEVARAYGVSQGWISRLVAR